jgi:head-tail adaptor
MRQAGKLDRQILVERKVSTVDPVFGTAVVSWEALSFLPGSPPVPERYWAEVLDALPSRSEAVQQGLQVARNQSRIRMRWRDDIDSSMRITVFGDTNRMYQIVAGPAEIAGRKGMLEMVVERYSST